MSNPKARAAVLMASPEDAEAQFYDALRDGDLDRVMAVWADDEEVICVHPGGARVVGPQGVRAAFEAIFASGTSVFMCAKICSGSPSLAKASSSSGVRMKPGCTEFARMFCVAYSIASVFAIRRTAPFEA